MPAPTPGLAHGSVASKHHRKPGAHTGNESDRPQWKQDQFRADGRSGVSSGSGAQDSRWLTSWYPIRPSSRPKGRKRISTCAEWRCSPTAKRSGTRRSKTAVQPEYVRKVGVKTVVELFRGPEPRVSLIRVNLQRGGGAVVSVDLTEQQLEAEAPLGAPLRDYVLGKADPGLFRYQVLTVRGGMRTPVYGMERGFHQPDHHHRGSGIAQQDVTSGIAGLPATASRL